MAIGIQGYGYQMPLPSISNNASSQQGQGQEVPRSSLGGRQETQHFVMGSDKRLEQLKDMYGDKALKQMGIIECATCASRQYVDGSNDPSVSFKTPAHVSPEASVAAVTSHEMEHVGNEQASAKAEGGQVVGQSVSIFMAVCPECGASYASGGVTRTTVSKPVDQEQNKGLLVDMKL